MEEHEVSTEFGLALRVYVHRGAKCVASVVTFHDIGTNYRSFLGFFNHSTMQIILENFCVYHVCAPGHHDSTTAAATDTSTGEQQGLLARQKSGGLLDGFGDSKSSGYPSLDDLAEMVQSVVRHFSIGSLVGVGMGAGANVLCRFALRNANNMLGLFLVNPSAHSDNTYYNWLFANNSAEWQRLAQGQLTESALKLLELHWFGHQEGNCPDLLESWRQQLLLLSPAAAAGYVRAYFDRSDLGIQRDLRPGTEVVTLPAQSFLVTGFAAREAAKALVAMNGRCDPAKTEFIIADDCDGMLMERCPGRLADYFLSHLHACGLVVYLTQAKVRALADRRHAEQMHDAADAADAICDDA